MDDKEFKKLVRRWWNEAKICLLVMVALYLGFKLGVDNTVAHLESRGIEVVSEQ